MTKHVDGTVFPYLDVGSNPTSSTKRPLQITGEVFFVFHTILISLVTKFTFLPRNTLHATALKPNHIMIKKLPLLFLILTGCNIIPPQPSDYTVEEVSVEGGPYHSVQDSVGLLLVIRGLPPTNEWEMIWEVNDQVVFSEEVSGKAGRISPLKKFKGTQSGEYMYKGCIIYKTMRICDEATFFLR